jgi:hypothetical protein
MVAEVEIPAGFVPQYALAFGAVDGPAVAVHAANPLSVKSVWQAGTADALAGTLSASSTVGPFVPELGRPIWTSLSGDWSGTVDVLRSADGGASKLPLTVGGERWGRFAANANEAVADESEAGATYYLAAALQTGTLIYRVAQ